MRAVPRSGGPWAGRSAIETSGRCGYPARGRNSRRSRRVNWKHLLTPRFWECRGLRSSNSRSSASMARRRTQQKRCFRQTVAGAGATHGSQQPEFERQERHAHNASNARRSPGARQVEVLSERYRPPGSRCRCSRRRPSGGRLVGDSLSKTPTHLVSTEALNGTRE